MFLLHIDLWFMYVALLPDAQLTCRLTNTPLAKVVHGKILVGNSGEAGTREDEVGLAAEDDHEDSDIKFTLHVEQWIFQIPLYYNFLEDGNLLAMLLLLG